MAEIISYAIMGAQCAPVTCLALNLSAAPAALIFFGAALLFTART